MKDAAKDFSEAKSLVGSAERLAVTACRLNCGTCHEQNREPADGNQCRNQERARGFDHRSTISAHFRSAGKGEVWTRRSGWSDSSFRNGRFPTPMTAQSHIVYLDWYEASPVSAGPSVTANRHIRALDLGRMSVRPSGVQANSIAVDH
jgi:hypothetical protein